MNNRWTVPLGAADSHSALFDHSADVVQVVSEPTNRQTQHLDLCLRPFGSEDEHTLTSDFWEITQ